MRVIKTVWVAAAILASGCVAQGPSDNPVERSLTYFSYLNGDDLRAKCVEGSPDSYRLVYNAVWSEQVRLYDIIQDNDRSGAMMEIRVLPGRANLLSVDLRDPAGPWRGTSALSRLAPADIAELNAALAASGFDGPTPDGKFLRSDSFYWLVGACRNGKFHFNAWDSPSAAFDRVGLLPVLLKHDRTGVAPNPVRHLYLGPFEPDYGSASPSKFQVQVGRDGLILGPRFR